MNVICRLAEFLCYCVWLKHSGTRNRLWSILKTVKYCFTFEYSISVSDYHSQKNIKDFFFYRRFFLFIIYFWRYTKSLKPFQNSESLQIFNYSRFHIAIYIAEKKTLKCKISPNIMQSWLIPIKTFSFKSVCSSSGKSQALFQWKGSVDSSVLHGTIKVNRELLYLRVNIYEKFWCFLLCLNIVGNQQYERTK